MVESDHVTCMLASDWLRLVGAAGLGLRVLRNGGDLVLGAARWVLNIN